MYGSSHRGFKGIPKTDVVKLLAFLVCVSGGRGSVHTQSRAPVPIASDCQLWGSLAHESSLVP